MGLAAQIVALSLAAWTAVLWLCSAAWAFAHARRHCRGAGTRWAALAVSLAVPFGGAALYALVRPCETKEERRLRSLRARVLEQELMPNEERCLVCRAPVAPAAACCASCDVELTHPCDDCGHPVRFGWVACPRCVSEPAREHEPLRVAA